MSWYLQSLRDYDTHRGVLARGTVQTACGIAFRPLRATRSGATLTGPPADPAQICPYCHARDPR